MPKLKVSSRYAIFLAGLASLSLAAAMPQIAGAKSLDGLTIAVSPSGDQLVAGGDTRTLLLLDPETMAVKKRQWIGTTIVELAFNKDGSILAVQDSRNTVFLYDTKTWKAKYKLAKFEHMKVSTAASIVAGVDNNWSGATVAFNSLKDGSNLGEFKLGAKERVSATGFSADGKKLAILTRAKKSKDEKKVSYSDIPKDLRGVARDEFRQRNNGETSRLVVVEAPSGKILSDSTTFYGIYGATIGFSGDQLIVIGSNSGGAKLKPDGTGSLFKTKNSSNYGYSFSPDQTLVLSGSSRNYKITTAPDLKVKANGAIRGLPGASEYFRGFTATADNKSFFAATSGYRVLKISGDGKLMKIEPVR